MNRSKVVTDYGIDALKNEGYLGLKEYISKEKRSGAVTEKLIYFLVIFLAATDGTCLYPVINYAMQGNAMLTYLLSFAIALILNVIPLIIGQYIHNIIYRTKRFALIVVVISVLVFVGTFATTINLRYQYKDDLYGEGSVDKIVNQVSIDESSEESTIDVPKKDPKALAVFWLFAIEPLSTSIMNLFLGLMVGNSVKKRINTLKKRQIELYEAKSDCEAALADMEIDIDKVLSNDYEKSLVMKDKIKALQLSLKAIARHILAEELGDPSSISKLCGASAGFEATADAIVMNNSVKQEIENAHEVVYNLSA